MQFFTGGVSLLGPTHWDVHLTATVLILITKIAPAMDELKVLHPNLLAPHPETSY